MRRGNSLLNHKKNISELLKVDATKNSYYPDEMDINSYDGKNIKLHLKPKV